MNALATKITAPDDDYQNVSIEPVQGETVLQAIQRALATKKAVETMIDKVFVDGVHYGTVPGIDKPTLFLPGQEAAMSVLGLREEYRDIQVERQFDPNDPFVYYEVECIIYSLRSGIEVARGQGVCHSREKSFKRAAKRTCPECSTDAIMRSKYPPRNNPQAPRETWEWYCPECKSNYAYNDPRITEQNVGGNMTDPQLVWDSINAIRKKANKRARADAVKRVACLSERFTTDVEDFYGFDDETLTKSEVVRNVPQVSKPVKWYEDKEAVTQLVKRAIDAGYGDSESDILSLVGVDSWSLFTTREEAGKAIKESHEALRAELSAQADDMQHDSKPLHWTQTDEKKQFAEWVKKYLPKYYSAEGMQEALGCSFDAFTGTRAEAEATVLLYAFDGDVSEVNKFFKENHFPKNIVKQYHSLFENLLGKPETEQTIDF